MTDYEKTYTLNEILETEENEEIIGHLTNDELEVIEAILELNYWSYDSEKKETLYTMEDLENALNDMENWTVTYWHDWDSYYDYCDDTLEFPKENSILERYFDYDAFHRDCGFDVSEASNGVIIANW